MKLFLNKASKKAKKIK